MLQLNGDVHVSSIWVSVAGFLAIRAVELHRSTLGVRHLVRGLSKELTVII